MRSHPNSRGWRSTKLHLALLCVLIITLVYVIGLHCADDQFSTYVTGLLGAAGVYSGSSAAEKFAPVPPPDVPSPEGDR